MIRNRMPALVNSLVAILLLGGIGYASRYYFSFDERHKATWNRIRNDSYPKLSWSWVRPDVETMKQHLSEGKLEDFERVVLATSLSRWRVQSFAPHAFENLMNGFRKGLWNASFASELISLINELDNQWINARRQFLELNEPMIQPIEDRKDDHGFRLRFPSGTKTSQLGSYLEVLMTVGQVGQPPDYMEMYWETVKNPGLGASRCKLASVVNTNQTTGGLWIYRITVDMSDVPEWLEAPTEPTYLTFSSPVPVQGTPLGYKWTDSPKLIIPRKLTSALSQ